jgi:hypothetical protein
MRRINSILLLLILTLPLASVRAQQTGGSAEAASRNSQSATTPSHVYQLGTRSVVIPPPAGFAEAFSQSDAIAKILIATEAPANEVLTAHLPVEVLDKIKRGEQTGYDFYTKVSVLKLAKAHDMSDAEFAALLAQVETSISQVFDINGPTMKSAVKNVRDALSNLSGKEVQVDFDQPQNLGSFDKMKNVYSFMMLMTFKGPQAKVPLLGGISLVKVNQRLIYVYTYRKFTSEKDAEVLRDCAKAWVRQILAANN